VSLAEDVNQQKRSAVELTKAALANIERLNPIINAFCSYDAASAMEAAAMIDKKIANGANLPLAGIPIGVKDLEDAKGFVTTFGSQMHVNDAPATADSVLVNRLREAGCVVLGKTNTPEFGFKGKTDNVPFGASCNPWDIRRTPGGSSGGTSAALASGMVPLATGSDGGGSIRIPAALCGLSGIKTSQGRVPNGGAKPPGSGLLTVKGPMTNRIRDAAYVLDHCMGEEPSDIFSLPKPTEAWYPQLDGNLPEKVVWSSTMGITSVDKQILKACETVVGQLADAGVEIIENNHIWNTNPFLPWLVFWTAARGRAQGHLRGTPEWEQIDADLRPQIEMGLDRFNAADYASAIDMCHILNLELETAFEAAPVILTPATRGHAPKIEGDGWVDGEETPDWVAFTMGINMTRNPAGIVPIGTSADGMPIGMQVLGRQRADLTVLKAMAGLEDLLSFNEKADI
jgi:Asp-tRNA(Asn)/Glu-tRNA(Gln) amidotransferase A subunit family amidase